MSEKTVTRLTPIVRELPADLETPVSVYLKLAGQGPSFLLESVTGGEQVARYSFIGVNPSQAFVLRGQTVEVHRLKPGDATGEELAAASGGLPVPEQELAMGGGVVSSQKPAPARRAVSNQTLPAGQNPLHFLRDILARIEYQPVPGLPRFAGGLVGFAGYEMMRFFEPSLTLAPHPELPDAIFLLADTIIAFDHAFGRLLLIGNAEVSGVNGRSEASINTQLDAIQARLAVPLSNTINPLPSPQPPAVRGTLSNNLAAASGLQPAAGGGPNDTPMASTSLQPAAAGLITANMTYEQYTAAVETAKEHIAAGDIFQVVLSQRMERQTCAAPFDIYRSLRRLNPSPYMFYLDFGDLAGAEPLRLIGASPEIHARLEGQAATVRPIAGTRPRGNNLEEDKRLEQELLADPKELAEHVMLVDLGRNDLGRVCRFGTVAAPEKMTIERYSHVMHIVSHVTGELQPGYDAFDLLQATFPAGTVSGAPKIRAMQIISELEAGPRGPYAGIVGYFSFDRSMDTCIAIRTMVMGGQTVSLQAGAGIVADSEPDREYQETLNKLRGQMAAIDLAEKV